LSKSKSLGGFCSNHSRSCSGVSCRKSGVSSRTSSSARPGGWPRLLEPRLVLVHRRSGLARSGIGGGRLEHRLLLEIGIGARRRGHLGRQLRDDVGLERLGVGNRLGIRIGGCRTTRDQRLGHLAAARRAQRLLLLAAHVVLRRTVATLELEVLTDGVVEQSHRPAGVYLDGRRATIGVRTLGL
jgi:hypothetical protein